MSDQVVSALVDKTVNSAVQTTPLPPITFEESLNYLTNVVPPGDEFDNVFELLEENHFRDFSTITNATVLKEYFEDVFSSDPIIKDVFVNDYKSVLRAGSSGFFSAPEDQGWGVDFLNVPNTVAAYEPQFEAWFDDFLTKYFQRPNTPNAGAIKDLMKVAVRTTATMTDNALNVNNPPPFIFHLPSYEKIFKAYFPDASLDSFKKNLIDFYQHRVQTKGFFIPSFHFAAWVQVVQDNYSQTAPGTPISGNSNLQSSNFEKTQILNDIFALIALMIGTMQDVASAQANRLRILTTWQAAYTYSLGQMHTFINGDHTPVGGTDPQETRDTLNNVVNFEKRNLVTTFQSTVGDDAKSLQSSINLSSDTVSQQASMATSIIQELNTLLNAIFK